MDISERGISIHAPHAGRDGDPRGSRLQARRISIHAPHAGRDGSKRRYFASESLFQSTRPMRGATLALGFTSRQALLFQSTRPMRGATVIVGAAAPTFFISIHAPHAGRDDWSQARHLYQYHFNPRAPCGARLTGFMHRLSAFNISIHAPHAGRDIIVSSQTMDFDKFQSTRPMRGATSGKSFCCKVPAFQSTRPMRGATPQS